MYFGKQTLDFRCLKILFAFDMKTVRWFVEQQLFGVCTWLGERMGIAIGSVRLYFIYVSFLTFGSPLLVYLVLAFWLNLRRYLRMGGHFVRDF